jgi:hypothetical protein
MKNLKAVFFVLICLAGYYSYAKADGHGGSGHGGRGSGDSSGHHSGDSSSSDTSHHGGHGSDTTHSSDSSGHHGSDSSEVRHDGDSTGHHGSDSTGVRHGDDDSTDVDHDSTEVEHDSSGVRHGGDDSTHHSGDSTHVGDHGGRGRDSLHVDDSLSHRHGRGTPAEDVSQGDDHRNTTSRVTRGESGEHRRDSVGHRGRGESESHGGAIFVGRSGDDVSPNDLPATFRLFDMNGALVAEWQADASDRTMPRMLAGRYMLRITTATRTETIKVQLGQR